jgi:methoxymalonate biosynthesis acyl carrier protein
VGIEQTLKEFVAGLCQLPGGALSAQESLFESRKLNSINLMELVTFVEETYSIQIGPMDLSLQNFDTVEKIATFVRQRTGSA